MTYSEFILKYPYIDLIMGFAPVVVAILAIFINNWRSGVRDKKNKRSDIIVKYENTLIEKVSAVDYALDELEKNFRKIMFCYNVEELENLLENYKRNKSEVLKCNVELYNYSFCTSDILYEKVNAKDTIKDVETIVEYINRMVGNRMFEQELKKIKEENVEGIKEIEKEIADIKARIQVDVKRIMSKTLEMLK